MPSDIWIARGRSWPLRDLMGPRVEQVSHLETVHGCLLPWESFLLLTTRNLFNNHVLREVSMSTLFAGFDYGEESPPR